MWQYFRGHFFNMGPNWKTLFENLFCSKYAYQGCRTRAVPVFGRSVNPISTRGQNMPTMSLRPSPGFLDLPTALHTTIIVLLDSCISRRKSGYKGISDPVGFILWADNFVNMSRYDVTTVGSRRGGSQVGGNTQLPQFGCRLSSLVF